MSTTTQTGLTGRQIGIVLLAAATGLIHLWLGISAGLIMFIANGLGYLVLAAAAYAPLAALARYRILARWALLAFAGITIVAWIAIGERSAIGFSDKAIEVLLVVLLLIELRRQ